MNHMTNQFLTDSTAIFDEFVRSLKRDTDNMPHIQNRGPAIILEAENEIETTLWIGEAKMTRGRTQEADTATTHEIPETHTSPRAIDKTIAMIHARDMDRDKILENVARNNKKHRFDLSHLALTGDKTAKN